jgi:hypothetical protein
MYRIELATLEKGFSSDRACRDLLDQILPTVKVDLPVTGEQAKLSGQ